jgi:Trypsin-co-occurring domain 1
MQDTDIKVQVVSADTGEVAFGPRRLPSFAERADELGDSLNEIATRLRGRLKELGAGAADGWDLDQVNLTFSLDLQAEAGVIVARASSRAGFQAAMTWKRAASLPEP